MSEISQKTQKLIQRYQDWYQSNQTKEGALTIHVDEVAAAVATFYEKMRGIIEWREEHLMKRTAIERILKRRMLTIKSDDQIAEPLIMELIRGKHFPNDKVPESKIKEAQALIDKYIFILESSPSAPKEKQKVHLFDWILGIAACELEEMLSGSMRERALIDFMTESMMEKIKLREGVIVLGGITEEEKNDQVYIAVQRALLKLDNHMIAYNLLKKRYPDWQKLTKSSIQLQQISQNIYSVWDGISKDLRHPLSDKFYKICERYDTPYLILGDVLSEDPMGAKEKIKSPEELEAKITRAYNKRLATLRIRTSRAAFYATLSIFITKILLAVLIEVPFDKLVINQFSYLALGINIITPPLLMLFLILTIKLPKKENLQRVIMETTKIVYETDRKDVYPIDKTRKRGFIMNLCIILFYTVTYVVSFGLIIFGLNKLDFGILSIIIFLLFASLISFAGIKLRGRSKELEMLEEKSSLLVWIIELFSTPVIRMGKWLSGQWAQYNIVVVMANFLIDMPFQRFVEFLEELIQFLREKKEEIH